MSVAPEGGRNRIMIYGPKHDGTYIIEFRMADGESLAISVPAGETRVLKHFQSACPMGSSCWTFREKPLARPCVSLTEPSNRCPKNPYCKRCKCDEEDARKVRH